MFRRGCHAYTGKGSIPPGLLPASEARQVLLRYVETNELTAPDDPGNMHFNSINPLYQSVDCLEAQSSYFVLFAEMAESKIGTVSLVSRLPTRFYSLNAQAQWILIRC